MFEEVQNGSGDTSSADTVSQAPDAAVFDSSAAASCKPSHEEASPARAAEPAHSADVDASSHGHAEDNSEASNLEKIQLQFGSFGKPDDAGDHTPNGDVPYGADASAETSNSETGSKAGGELRVEAAEFVPGQWDKPKQAAAASEMIVSGSQHSLSALTDEDSVVQGSDTNTVGWTAAEYSQQYYIAQGWTWSEQYQQYGIFGYDESGLYRWYTAPPIEEWPAAKGGSWGHSSGQPGGFYMAERAGRAQRQRGAFRAQQQAGAPPPPPQPRAGPRQVLAKPILPAERRNNTAIASVKRLRKEPLRSVSALKEAYGADAVTEAGLAILEQQFPAYSRPALKELLEAAGGDVSSALDSMSFLEAEHSNHRTSSKPAKSQAISLDEDNFPVLQSPARPKQASFLHRATPDKAAEGLHERPRSPVSTLNQAPSATPSPAPTSAADLHSGHVTPIKATATSTCSDTGTDASAPHQAPPAAASTCSEGEEAQAAPAPEAAREAHPSDGESQDDSTSSDKTTAADGAAAEEPATAAADGEAAPQTEGQSGDAEPKEEAPQKRFVPAEAPAVSAWGRSSKLLFEPRVSGGSASTGSSTPRPPAPPASQPQENGAAARKGASGRRSPQSEAPWVVTGAGAEAQYNSARRDARDHMRMRNTFFQQATQAYLEGDKALAKKLGASGRWHAAQMAKAHQLASEDIFRQRNPSPQGKAGGLPVIDLHGQHVNEALRIIERELSQRRNQKNGLGRSTQILVGTSHHTKAKHSPMRLAEAVENLLQKENIPFSKPVPGVLEISA